MGRERVSIDVGRFVAKQKGGLEKAMRAAALQGEAELKVILSQPGSGEIYPRGKEATHQASAPGEPPAPDLGRLRASVSHEVVVSGDAVVARISANTQYALALELGTEKTAPRPFLRPLIPRLRAAAKAALARFL